MSSKKEEERNEKIIRGLMKLPPNRRCINCDSLGPQYVCTNFWTFICIACSGIHREFTHRVKSVSMAKFTSQEVEALQKGGNQRAKEMFLQEWDAQRTKLPASGNVDKIREFIRHVYVDKKYAGGRSLEKPPRDTQSVQNHEDLKRASSYHSFSQSPPYEHQYEDRRSGKQTAVLSRKPGSDRGHYEGKISSFIYSPGRPGEHMYEDKFANDGSGSRSSDYTASSTGDPFRSFGQSPNFQDAGYTSPPSQQVRDILFENAKPQTLHTYAEANMKKDFDGIHGSQTTQSSSSYGSLGDTNAANSGSLKDIVSKNGHASESLNAGMAAFSFPHLSTSEHSGNQYLFNVRAVQLTCTSMDTSSDLFAGINDQDSSAAPAENKLFAVPLSEDVGWATFDLPHHAGPASEAHKGLPPTSTVGGEASKESTSTIPFMSNNPQWFPVQKSASHGPSSLITDQWDAGLHDIKPSVDPNNSQFWNAFDAAAGSISQSSSVSLPQNGGMQFPMHTSALGDSSVSLKASEFMDMSPLQEALPNMQLPTTFLDGLSNQWFSQDPITSYIPSVVQGDLAYMARQTPSSQLPNISSQGHVASLGGNPFA